MFRPLHVSLSATAMTAALTCSSLAQDLDEAALRKIVVEEIQANPQLVLDAILANPDVVMQAVAILREREDAAKAAAAQEAFAAQKLLLTTDPNAPVMGNPDGDVVVVEFFDYNCPYCKAAAENVAKLVSQDAGVKVLYREWPILSESSATAARASLASRKQGLYEPFHDALMGQKGRLNEALIMKVARSVGLDIDQLKADMVAPDIDEHLETSNRLAQALQFSGTPSFVIGDELIPGMIDLQQMQLLVDAAREES